MVSEGELLNVLKSTLQENGSYARMKADLNSQLIEALGLNKQLTDANRPQPPADVDMLNHLIREYLNWSGLKFTEMMFSTEARVPPEPTPRAELCRRLNVKDSPSTEQIPLLLSILSTLKEKAQDNP